MSPRRRFGHLESARPARAPEPPRAVTNGTRFSTLESAEPQVACALCGAPLAGAEAQCANCARTTADAAATVPAWRGEALPPDVAEEVLRKVGPPGRVSEEQARDPLAWADRQLARERNDGLERWLQVLMWRPYRGSFAVRMFPVALVLLFFFGYRACR